MNELFILRVGEKTASKDCIITIKIRYYIDSESNIMISSKMDTNLTFYVLKNHERIEKIFQRSQVNVQRLALAFKVREKCFSKFIKINTFVTLTKTFFFVRNLHK